MSDSKANSSNPLDAPLPKVRFQKRRLGTMQLIVDSKTEVVYQVLPKDAGDLIEMLNMLHEEVELYKETADSLADDVAHAAYQKT